MRSLLTFPMAMLAATLFSPPALAQPAMQLANPASTHCATVGGRTMAEKNPRGGAYGVCVFEDNRQCEEWALLRGHCPVGGLRVTGYVTLAARYCAITGGTYAITTGSGTPHERGTCATPRGPTCDAQAWYDGTCAR